MTKGTKKKITLSSVLNNQFFIPVLAITLLVIFDLITNIGFFKITVNTNSLGNPVLAGNIITVLRTGTELVFLAVGMTLVTAATGGQDISVGATLAISGSVIFRIILASAGGGNDVQFGTVLIAFLAAVLVAMICGAFNGVLVAFFKIQPMVATLILYTAGRSIAQWINNNANMKINDPKFNYIGSNIPGVAIPTPIIITVVFLVIVALALKFTTLGLNIQTVGINEGASRLNGINPTLVKFATFVILGFCAAVAGLVYVSRTGSLNYTTAGKDIEMDAILAVALGGNSLAGGKFNVWASVLGAYAIQLLYTSLNGSKFIDSDGIKAYKAVIIILLVVFSSPKVRDKMSRFFKKNKKVEKEAA